MASDFPRSEQIIRAEYQRLCNYLGLTPTPLEVYVCDVNASASDTTPLGISVSNCAALYSGTKRLMALPLAEADDWPTILPDFPPPDLNKHSENWPTWRIELWHEVVHQVSNDLLTAWDPNESPRCRPNQTRSQPGHGLGWFDGVKLVARKLGVEAEELDALLDQ
jgi:hypothetical protein